MAASASSGSGLFKNARAKREHLTQGTGGLSGEIGDLRADVAKALGPVAALSVEEYIDVPAAGTALLKSAAATAASAQVFKTTDLNGSVGANAIVPPRNVTVTTAGGTAADAPATATIKGFDAQGKALSETITVSQTAATAAGTKCFAKVTEIDLPAADGTGATLAFGLGALIGLSRKPKVRGGGVPLFFEVVDGAIVTSSPGTLSTPTTNAPFGAYSPSTAPNGTHDYAIYFEMDGTA